MPVLVPRPDDVHPLIGASPFRDAKAVVPVPPSGLDFASSAQFWSLLADLGGNLDQQEVDGARKVFDFLHILLSRVDQADAASPAVR